MFKQVLLFLLTFIFPKQEYTYTKEYIIDTDHIPQYVYWIDGGNVLLSSSGYTQIFNTDTRKSNTIDTCNECIYGYDYGFIYCKYEHRGIQSVDEFSTTISVYDVKSNLLFTKDIFPTVIPVVCKREYVILKSAYSFLEQKTYVLNWDSGELKEYVWSNERKEIQDINDEYITVSKSKDMEKLILLDEGYRLWVYYKKDGRWVR